MIRFNRTHLLFKKAALLLALLFYAVFFSANINALTLKAQVDKTTLSKEETLNLVVSIDSNVSSDLDFSQLAYEFDIINNQRSSRITISNGQKKAKTSWVLVLAPKDTGTLTIPVFTYKNTFSSSISIKVTDQAPVQKNSSINPDTFLEFTADKKNIYVQEQVLITARLYYKIALVNYEPEKLKIDKARIEALHKEDKVATFRGERYKVLEEVYALHPQASGKFTLPIQTWRLEKPSRRFGFGNSTNPYLYVRSNELTLDVQPIPDNKSINTDWLPSKEVTLSAEWKQSPVQASIGEPLNLQITLSAQGLSDYQLPNLKLKSTSDFTIYDAQPEAKNNTDSQGIIGVRKLNYSIIPRNTGQFTLPEVSIIWWNIEKNREEITTLPEQVIIVAKSAITNNDAEPSQKLPMLKLAKEKVSSENTSLIFWQIMSLIFVIVILLLCYQIYRMKNNSRLVNKSNIEDNSNTIFTSMQKNIIAGLKTQIENKDWQQLRKDLIKWGQLVCDDEGLDSLHQLALNIPELALHLQQLDNHLYGQQPDDSYNPTLLLELIKNYKHNVAKNKKTVLQPLY